MNFTACLPLTEYQYGFLEYRCLFQSVFFLKKERKELGFAVFCFFFCLFYFMLVFLLLLLHVTTADYLVTVSPGYAFHYCCIACFACLGYSCLSLLFNQQLSAFLH